MLPTPAPALLAYPMHGQRKLLREGYRTRDGHIIEWAGHLTASRGGVAVVSRPEPALLPRRRSRRPLAEGTTSIDATSGRLPDPRNRRRWWATSAAAYQPIEADASTPAIIWNPFVALAPAPANPFRSGRATILDLLDDWTAHFAFQSIGAEVERAYAAAFASATHVTANGAGTEALARRFGRDDVQLVPNGCDPERFSGHSSAHGPLTVGYVGKIGQRLDLEGVLEVVRALPTIRFVFAGPILDRGYRPALAQQPNVSLLGDVHYEEIPALLETFDVGWVPHRVGDGEVGGDVIKTYEYRAAGLPVLATPFCSVTDRGLDHVHALPIAEHLTWLTSALNTGPRVARRVSELPATVSWRSKTEGLLRLLDVPTLASAPTLTSSTL